jgi:hypothetical protein
LTSQWRFESPDGKGTALKALPVGKYTLQVIYEPQPAKDETGWQGKALTGSVDIEVRVKPAPTVPCPGGGGGGGRPVPTAPRPRQGGGPYLL